MVSELKYQHERRAKRQMIYGDLYAEEDEEMVQRKGQNAKGMMMVPEELILRPWYSTMEAMCFFCSNKWGVFRGKKWGG